MDLKDLGSRWRLASQRVGRETHNADAAVVTHVDGELRYDSALGPRIGPGFLIKTGSTLYATAAGGQTDTVWWSYVVLT